MRHFTHKAAIPCSLLVVLFAPLSASAAVQESQVATARVSYADLDLAHRQGAEMLYTRIRSAAHQMCEPAADSAPRPFARLEERRCMDKAIAGAVAKVNAPLLTDLYHGDASRTFMIAQK